MRLARRINFKGESIGLKVSNIVETDQLDRVNVTLNTIGTLFVLGIKYWGSSLVG